MYYIPVNPTSISNVLKIYFQQLTGSQINLIIIGANDGELKDFLTKYVRKRNVRGVMVEPVPYLFNSLKKKFKDSKNLSFENSAIDRRSGTKTIYRVKEKGESSDWSKGLGSFNKKVILGHENQMSDLRQRIISEKVRCITIAKLIKKHKLEKVNLLQIDTEGHDYEIIKSIDFVTIRPDIIIIEYMHITLYQYFAVITLLIDHKYRVNKSDNSFDLIAVDEEIL